jgi:hypothetical protein
MNDGAESSRFPPEPEGRDRVDWLVHHTPAMALGAARQLVNPWYKTQALASATRAQRDEPSRLAVLEEAFTTALGAEDGYRQVGCAVWPLAVAVNLGMHDYARVVLSRPGGLVAQLDGVTPDASLCYVLDMLIDATLPLGRDVYRPLALRLAAKAIDMEVHRRHWRGGHMLRSTIDLLRHFDPALAEELCGLHPDERKRAGLRNRMLLDRAPYRFFADQ